MMHGLFWISWVWLTLDSLDKPIETAWMFAIYAKLFNGIGIYSDQFLHPSPTEKIAKKGHFMGE